MWSAKVAGVVTGNYFGRLGEVLMVGGVVTVAVDGEQCYLLSFPPRSRLLSSSLTMCPVKEVSLGSSESFFGDLYPYSRRPVCSCYERDQCY